MDEIINVAVLERVNAGMGSGGCGVGGSFAIRKKDGYEMQFGRRRLAVTGAPVISAGKCETAVRDGVMPMPESAGFMTQHHSQLDALS